MTKILIVDDHPIFRRGLKQVLATDQQFSMIGEAANAVEAWEHLYRERWDALVLDISLPGKTGLEFLSELKRRFPELPTLVLSMYPEEQYAMRMLRAGASGYLTKDRAANEFVKALRKLLHGERYISESVAERLAMNLATPRKNLYDWLSVREREVMTMIAAGNTPKIIAATLSLSPRTVATYRIRLLEKLQLKNNAQLVKYTIENKLCELTRVDLRSRRMPSSSSA